MKIAVVAGNGRAARKIISEAVSRGLEVTAFGRRDNNTDAQHYVKKDIFDLTYLQNHTQKCFCFFPSDFLLPRLPCGSSARFAYRTTSALVKPSTY